MEEHPESRYGLNHAPEWKERGSRRVSEYRGENERAERTEGFIFVVRVKRRDKTMHHRGGIQGHQQESYRFAEYPSAFSSNECHGHIISTNIRPYVL